MDKGTNNATKSESREQTIKKISFYMKGLTDEQLRLVAAFMRGLKNG